MKHTAYKKQIVCAILLLCSLVCAQPALADGGFSYTYDYWKTAVAVPEPYSAQRQLLLSGFAGGTDSINAADMFVGGDGCVYVLDAANSCVIKLNRNLSFIKNITFEKDNQALKFLEAKGLFVDKNENIYIADKKVPCVYMADKNGRVYDSLKAPPADKVESGFQYTPSKILVDTAGIRYVISDNTYSGALQYDENGQFIGFYGCERVTVTPKLLLNELWKKILTKEAAKGLERNVPTSFINFDIDADNFIYTIKGGTGLGTGQVRKLNSQGTNILLNDKGDVTAFGDLDTYFDSQTNLTVSTTLSDIVVDDKGFITVLDNTRNRLFQYDQSSHLLFAFGGNGDRLGCYKTPVAIEALGDTLLVLDNATASITELKLTEFGESVRNAILLYDDGLYKQAMKPWQTVLKYDASYELANVGMGKIYAQLGDYQKAMDYSKKGNDKEGYSDAFMANRDVMLRKNFAVIISGVVVLLLLMVVLTKRGEKRPKNEYNRRLKTWQYPFFCMLHPFKGYYDMKMEKKSNKWIAIVILAAFFTVSIISSQLTGFDFNSYRTDHYNVFITLGMTIGFFLMFVFCNWAVSTLADGEGKFMEIFNFTAYALLPYVLSLAALTVLSNCFSLKEAAFYGVAQSLAFIWTGVNLIMAVREVHQYTLGKTLWVLCLNLLGMYLLLLIITIGYSMFTQLVSFITMIYNEIRLK